MFQTITSCIRQTPKIVDEQIVADPARDLLKLVVVERHHATGNIAVGFVRGFSLSRGALGSTVAHDAHNVVVVGTNDDDIVATIEALKDLGGGQIAVADGRTLAALPLPIAGLVSDQPLEIVIEKITALNAAAKSLGCPLPAPFMSLSFLSPIPRFEADRSRAGRRGENGADESARLAQWPNGERFPGSNIGGGRSRQRTADAASNRTCANGRDGSAAHNSCFRASGRSA